MRSPSWEIDGWELEDGEDRHRAAPATFEIPDLAVRQALYPGCFAKLIFRIALEGDGDPEACERMWVIVREILPDGSYIGMLDNQPSEIAENDSLWLGSELPFEPRHVIDVGHANDESVAAIAAPPAIPWSR